MSSSYTRSKGQKVWVFMIPAAPLAWMILAGDASLPVLVICGKDATAVADRGCGVTGSLTAPTGTGTGILLSSPDTQQHAGQTRS